MNMIQKTYECEVPEQYAGSFDRSFKVSAWTAMGSDTVNFRSWDPKGGWDKDYPENGITAVQTERISDYAHMGIRTMDALVEYLFYVKA